jgi:hypothetical protein
MRASRMSVFLTKIGHPVVIEQLITLDVHQREIECQEDVR